MLLLLATLASAAPVDALHDDSVARALAGDCPAAEPGLLRRVDASADDLPARLALDACRYAGTERGAARADLEALYRVGAPFDPGLLARRRAADPAALARLQSEAQAALLVLVRTMVAAGAHEEARGALLELEGMVGASGPTAAAGLHVERAQNGARSAWPLATRALERWPEDLDVLEELGRLVFDDAAQAPGPLVDAVLIRGRASARLNVLLGHVRAGLGPACLERAGRAAVPAAERPAFDAVVYRCAVAAGELERAAALRASAQPPLDPAATIRHAQLLLAQGRPDEALALALPLAGREDSAMDVVLEAYALAGRAADIERLAAATPAGSFARLAAGSRLLKLREPVRARLLLEGTCASYTGDRASLCGKIVDSARAGR